MHTCKIEIEGAKKPCSAQIQSKSFTSLWSDKGYLETFETAFLQTPHTYSLCVCYSQRSTGRLSPGITVSSKLTAEKLSASSLLSASIVAWGQRNWFWFPLSLAVNSL